MRIDIDGRQRGVALVFALLVLLLLSLLVSAVMRSSTTQLRMARNLETAALERQQVMTEIERVLAHLGVEAPAGAPGRVHCRSGGAGCESQLLAQMSEPMETAYSEVRVVATGRTPPRVDESAASSGLAYRTVHYEVAAGLGQTSLAQGVAVLVAEPLARPSP